MTEYENLFYCHNFVAQASDKKGVQMSCGIKAARALMYYCANDKLGMLRIERWSTNAQKLPDGDWPWGAYWWWLRRAGAYVTENKRFWKTIKPFFTDKTKNSNHIILTKNFQTIREDEEICKVFNT